MTTINGRRVTDGEYNLVYSTPKATLRAACKGEGLPISGTGWQLAWRLIDAGISHEHVLQRYSWRARLQPDPAVVAAVERSADAFARRWPSGNMSPNVRPVDHDRNDLT